MHSSELQGFVELVTREFVSGWVIDFANPDNPVAVEVIINGALVGTTLADISRADLGSFQLGTDQFAFQIPLPPGAFIYLDEIEVRVVGSDLVLPMSATAGQLEGVVETRSQTIVEGWAWRVGDPDEALTVELVEGKTVIMATTASRPRSDLKASGVGTGSHGFVFEAATLGRLFYDPADLHVRVEGTRNSLPVLDQLVRAEDVPAPRKPLEEVRDEVWSADTVISSTGPKVEGEVRYDAGILDGWIRDPASDEPCNIEVRVGGAKVWSGLARRMVEIDGVMKPLGFRVQLPRPDKVTTERAIEILYEGSPALGSPIVASYGAHLLGHVEKVIREIDGSLRIEGWAMDTLHVSEAVPLNVFIGSELVAVSAPDHVRKDLAEIGYDAPYAGFVIDLPPTIGARLEDVSQLWVKPEFSSKSLSMTEEIETVGPVSVELEQEAVAFESDEIEGTIDEISQRTIRGWARNKNNSAARVILDCYIDNVHFATSSARRFRSDLAKHFGDHGFHEYLFELTPSWVNVFPGRVRIEPRVGVNRIKHKIETLSHPLAKSKIVSGRKRTPLKDLVFSTKPATREVNESVALIVINRNGAELLHRFFLTFYRHNSYANHKILVIDHASVDDSELVCRDWAAKGHSVEWWPRDGNYSFSASNNYGVANCDADVVICANNDLTFVEDLLPKVMGYMQDPRVGALGIKLLDDLPGAEPTTDAAIQHLGVHFQGGFRGSSVEAFESRYAPIWEGAADKPVAVPCVTGAFLACRRDEFLKLGGYNEEYFYGYEDVDLCLAFKAAGLEVVSANDCTALHLRGFSREKMDASFNVSRLRNRDVLDERFGVWLRRAFAGSLLERPGYFTATLPRIAFAVTEANEKTLAGDYFTALELASQLAAIYPCECVFVEKLAGNYYDLTGCDVVIAMLDDYDPSKIKGAPPHLLKVAWVRNWFERFAQRETSRLFDMVWASSKIACDLISAELGKPVAHLPIATNWYRFEAGRKRSDMASDYCFTGSFWGLNREIIQMLDPGALPFTFALYGTGWDGVPRLAPYARGSLPYKQMPDVYANTRICIDDANHVTKAWGGVNSRVFDAIAAGALVVTNGRAGAQGTFDGLLPVYDTPQELEDLLWTYLTDEPARLELVGKLQAFVKAKHTYQERAHTVWATLKDHAANALRFSIKIGAPNAKVWHEWGDYHFALSMKFYLERMGHVVRIDALDTWDSAEGLGDDVVIVLRGLSKYNVKRHQINLMWNISHPDKISVAEYEDYDHVFIASHLHAAKMKSVLKTPVSTLLQCTDPRFFHPDVERLEERPGVLFIGNSRNVYRPIVRDAIAANLPLEVYGSRWVGLIPDEFIKGQYLANSRIASYYASAELVLNDHWANMAEYGLVSNRLFDLVACGARVASDQVEGTREIFGDAVSMYSTPEDLAAIYRDSRRRSEVQTRQAAEHVMANHSFENRVQDILAVARKLIAARSQIKVNPFDY